MEVDYDMNKRLVTLVISCYLLVTLFAQAADAAYANSYLSSSFSYKDTLIGPPLPHEIPAMASLAADGTSRSGVKMRLEDLVGKVPDTLNYVVRSGDSLYRIAGLFNTTVNQLLELNDLQDPHFLRIEQQIKVPNSAKHSITPNLQIKQVLSADLTAYTAGPESTGKRPGDPAYGITASGRHVKDFHTIAVDPSIIPLGTKVYIEGIGVRTAEDTGGAIKGNRIDVYMSDLGAAIQFGFKRNIKVYILEETAKNNA
jgi:3D (Asp-Asp-Asp) domain-containing protein